jgi:GH24 family phage-related lysozyme (muramidase)
LGKPADNPILTKEDLELLEARIKKEIRFIHIPLWSEPPGGHTGHYIWAWNVEAPGQEVRFSMPLADRHLRRDVERAISVYADVFKNCTTEICPSRRLALVDLIFDLGEERFRKQRRPLNRIFHSDWKGAAAEFRAAIWYKHACASMGRAKRIIDDIETGEKQCPSK